jgi:hypothetical protein
MLIEMIDLDNWCLEANVEVEAIAVKGATVFCRVNLGEDREGKLRVEFYNDTLAIRFEFLVIQETARLFIDENLSLERAPKAIREEYELALISGDSERLDKVLNTLYEDMGISPENPPHRKTSGIKRLIFFDGGYLFVFGFLGREKEVCKWLEANDLDWVNRWGLLD